MATRKTKRYDDGGAIEPGSGYEDSNAGMKEAYDASESEARGQKMLEEMRDTEAAKPSNFREAFAAARKSGDKTFEFGGKKYTTEMASSKPAKITDTGDEVSRLAGIRPKPAPRQQETMQDRAERYVAKRAAQRQHIIRQSRILRYKV